MNTEGTPDGFDPLRAEIQTRFAQVGETILSHLRAMVGETRRQLNCAECGLLVPADDGNSLRFLVSANSREGIADIVEKLRIPLETSLAGFVYSTCQPISVSNPDDYYPGVDEKTGLETRFYLATPIIDDDNVIGVLTCVNRPDGTEQLPFDGDEINLSGMVASALGCGIRFYRRFLLNHELLCQDLNSQSIEGVDDYTLGFGEESGMESSALARAVNELEKLSDRGRETAAALINVLLEHDTIQDDSGGEIDSDSDLDDF